MEKEMSLLLNGPHRKDFLILCGKVSLTPEELEAAVKKDRLIDKSSYAQRAKGKIAWKKGSGICVSYECFTSKGTMTVLSWLKLLIAPKYDRPFPQNIATHLSGGILIDSVLLSAFDELETRFREMGIDRHDLKLLLTNKKFAARLAAFWKNAKKPSKP